jgi:hypothetical protein
LKSNSCSMLFKSSNCLMSFKPRNSWIFSKSNSCSMPFRSGIWSILLRLSVWLALITSGSCSISCQLASPSFFALYWETNLISKETISRTIDFLGRNKSTFSIRSQTA